MGRARFDLVAGAASVLAIVMLIAYLSVMRQQDDEPAAWAVVALLIGAVTAGYGALGWSPYRRVALVVGGLVLGALGLLAILSIGLPIIAAGVLCFVAAARGSAASAPVP
jgi:hypothetical protein